MNEFKQQLKDLATVVEAVQQLAPLMTEIKYGFTEDQRAALYLLARIVELDAPADAKQKHKNAASYWSRAMASALGLNDETCRYLEVAGRLAERCGSEPMHTVSLPCRAGYDPRLDTGEQHEQIQG